MTLRILPGTSPNIFFDSPKTLSLLDRTQKILLSPVLPSFSVQTIFNNFTFFIHLCLGLMAELASHLYLKQNSAQTFSKILIRTTLRIFLLLMNPLILLCLVLKFLGMLLSMLSVVSALNRLMNSSSPQKLFFNLISCHVELSRLFV